MNIPFTEAEYNKFTDFQCKQCDDCCQKCIIQKECAPYCEFERGFALNDKKIIDKGLRFAQKMNSKNYKIFRIKKDTMAWNLSYDRAEELIKEYEKVNSSNEYIIKLTES